LKDSLMVEQSVIGGLLLDNSKWTEASEVVNVSDFQHKQHQAIFTAIGQQIHKGNPADVLTLNEGHGFDLAYLGELAKNTPSAANCVAYAEMVRKAADDRKIEAAIKTAANKIGKTDAATIIDELFTIIEPIQTTSTIKKKINSLDLSEILQHQFPKRESVLNPVFNLCSLNMIYSWRGVGKTHTALGLAYAASSGGSLFAWKANRPFKTLYIDGEMPGEALQERLAAIATANEKQPPDGYFQIATIDLNDGKMPDLSTTDGQKMIAPLCKEAEVIIVDNLSCMARSGRENEAESWVPLSEWALKLRAAGKCVIFVHHAGKDGQQRGTSKREDILDIAIELKRPADYSPEQGARFIVKFQKSRHLKGNDADSFEACLITNSDEKQIWTTTSTAESNFDQIVELTNSGYKQSEIARELEINPSTVSRNWKRGVSEGKINPKEVKQ
jgi:hypothetical protein